MSQPEPIKKRLDGKIAVITGASSGIGLATAQRFVNDGAYVFITGRRQNELNSAVKEIGENVNGVQGDVSNLKDLDRLYETIKQHKGRIDILFANAGVTEFAPLGTITETHFDKIFSVNVKGVLFTVQKALPLFQNGGSIILNSSVGGSKGYEGFSVYGATKAAIRSFARSWTVDLKHRNIRVNVVSPGPINTPIFRSAGQNEEEVQQVKKYIASTIPLGRIGNPEEIASAVSFLASDDSSFVTGIEMFVDGGIAQV
jgi:NAD(P)-dependent dehydrogenase (short-subunit alcohol dehydrogenase family)